MHEYLRVSSDRSGVEKSPTEQHDENQAARQGRNWRQGETYRDKGSASKFATRVRKDYERLVADLGGGTVFARGDLLALWESSRGGRRESEWHLLLDLLEDCGVLVYVTSRDRVLDPADEYDRETLSREGSQNATESARTSKRVRRATAAHAAAGLPYGRVPYGYRRIYDEVTRKLVRQDAEPAEAAVVRELFDRLDSGEKLLTITGDFANRKITTRGGAAWSQTHLRSIAMKHLYAGLRVYDPKRFHGGTNNGWPTEDAVIVEGTWPALVDRDLFWRVYHQFAARRKSITADDPQPRDGRARHLLSAIVVCDVCDAAMAPWNNQRTGRVEYRCYASGCVRIDRDDLDSVVTRVIIGYLACPENFERADAGTVDVDLARVRADLAQARAEHDALADSGISVALAAKKEPGILARIRVLEARERELRTPDDLRGVIEPGEDVALHWESLLLPAKRRIARLVLTPERVGQLRIQRGRGVPAAQRVNFRRAVTG